MKYVLHDRVRNNFGAWEQSEGLENIILHRNQLVSDSSQKCL